jgi:hypothetical protein
VEFEPTGNQAPLDRPLAPRENDSLTGLINPGNLINEDPLLEEPLNPLTEEEQAELASTTNPLLSPWTLLLTLILLSAVTVFLSRRYALPERIPSAVRAAIERNGIETPAWILNWERWVKLSPIEKSFESVNFGLRQFHEPAAIHATPIERADSLVRILPDLAPTVKILLDEHQTSLYTSRTADAGLARRAAYAVRSQIILARIRHFWTGKYSPRK